MLKLLLILVAFSSGVLCQEPIVAAWLPSPDIRTCYPGSTTCSPRVSKKPTAGCVNNVGRSDYVVTEYIGAHKLHRRKLTWDQARKSCMAEGAQLAIINSNEEETILLDLMSKQNVEFTWLGVHDHFEEGDWVTLTGESMYAAGYSRWTTRWPDQPNDIDGTQNCGILVKEGGLSDGRCSMRLPYFCKINIC